MEELRNAGKIINILIDQLSKNSEVIQAPIINPQSKNLFPETVEENMTTVKYRNFHIAQKLPAVQI